MFVECGTIRIVNRELRHWSAQSRLELFEPNLCLLRERDACWNRRRCRGDEMRLGVELRDQLTVLRAPSLLPSDPAPSMGQILILACFRAYCPHMSWRNRNTYHLPLFSIVP